MDLKSIAFNLIGCLIAYYILAAFFNLYISPLSRVPGPRWHAVSFIPVIWHTIRGKRHLMHHKLHEKYGDTVRYSPTHISFCNERAFKEILTRKPGRGQLMKDPGAYNSIAVGKVHSIFTTPSDDDHSRYRQLLSHGFSEAAIKEQEPILLQYVDLLLFKLKEHAKDGTAQDMVAWFNWTTFDLIGDLTFNESFSCLDSASYHPWIQFVFGTIKAGAIMSALKFIPVVSWILLRLLGKTIRDKRRHNAKFTAEKVAHRLASQQTDRTDFFEFILNPKKGGTKMTIEEVEAMSAVLVLGGSETTATLLAGVTYLLLKHPRVLHQVTAEIRSSFKREGDINSSSVKGLTYLLAVLNESMRIFPPAPIGSPRMLPEGGDIINGYALPAKTVVVGIIYAAFHSSRNWADPDEFVPERWLGNERYEGDARGVFQPFSLGPRNCIAKSLAYAEMCIIMARILWHFDMELAEPTHGWMEGMKVFTLWEKPKLLVKLTSRYT